MNAYYPSSIWEKYRADLDKRFRMPPAAAINKISRRLVRVGVCALILGSLGTLTGCSPLSIDDARRLAEVASWTGQYRVSVEEKDNQALWRKAKIVFGYGPGPSDRARIYLRRYDVEPNFKRTKLEAFKAAQDAGRAGARPAKGIYAIGIGIS